ncbi:hypothetical protein GCM10009825_34110 [Arthrobacter humicola]|uniref:Uncharacterized protein n=2 Tax=Arthrobacter humicola TaxID=409291 RepID=A0ABP5LCB9_9MICC
MRGNPDPRVESVHPFHRPMAIIDNPRVERRKANEQQDQTGDGGQAPAPPVQASEQVLPAELADFLWRRQEPGLDQLPSSTGGRGNAQNFGIWRDQLLAEIENIAGKLRVKVERYALVRAAYFSDQAAEPTNEVAVAWIQDALEDIAATAVGIEIASRELFLRAKSAGEQDLRNETVDERQTGTAE